LADGVTKEKLEDYFEETLKPIREARKTFILDQARLIDIQKVVTDKSRIRTVQALQNVTRVLGLNVL